MNQQKKVSLRRKILDLSLGTALSVIIILLIVSTSITLSVGTTQVKEKGIAKVKLIAQSLDGVLRNVTYNIKAFSTSNSLQATLKQTYPPNNYGIIKFASSLQSEITSIMDIDTFVKNGFIQTSNGWSYNLKTHSVNINSDTTKLTNLKDSFGQIIISISQPDDVQKLGIIHFNKILIDIDTGKTLGMLSFELATERLYESFISTVGADESVFLLSQNVILSEIDNLGLHKEIVQHLSQLSHAFTNLRINGKRFAFFSQPLLNTDAVVIYTISYQSLLKQIVRGILFIVLLCSLLVFIVIVVTKSFSQNITIPLEQLSIQAERISNGFFKPILQPPTSTEEIAKLTKCLNKMIENIQSMSSQIYSQQNEKREAELSLLQAQINPHFLYNCLDNVETLMNQKEYQTVQKMILEIEKYYRLNLSGGRNIITLQEEIQLTHAYLELQAIRHQGLFTFTIEIPASLALYKCIKMLFQPIVENSIKHGLIGTTHVGKIEIKVIEEKENIVCLISDNGHGMDKKKIKDIFETESEDHYGLKSMIERLELAYGNSGGLEIQSEEGVGTCVRIHFPKTI